MVEWLSAQSVTDWLTAVGTVGAVVLSLYLARQQGREARKQERLQQAEKVTGWLAPYTGPIGDRQYEGLHIGNASHQLVYDLVAQAVSVQGAFRVTAVGDSEERNLEFGTLVGNVPPGQFITRLHTGGGGMHVRLAVELAFQDAAGKYWLRHGSGILEEVDKHPLDLYRIPRPVSWEH
jgi:hypothetical protein